MSSLTLHNSSGEFQIRSLSSNSRGHEAVLHIYSRFRGHFSCLTTDASMFEFTTEDSRERPEDDEIFSSNAFNSQTHTVGSSSKSK